MKTIKELTVNLKEETLLTLAAIIFVTTIIILYGYAFQYWWNSYIVDTYNVMKVNRWDVSTALIMIKLLETVKQSKKKVTLEEKYRILKGGSAKIFALLLVLFLLYIYN